MEIKFDINKVVVKDLDGSVLIVNTGKALGNSIYKITNTLDWLDIAKTIHSGNVIELGVNELTGLKSLISSNNCELLICVKVGILDYINELIGSPKGN